MRYAVYPLRLFRMPARTGPTKFELRREATRAELIRLALERLPIKGYAATTIEDIVRGSSLSRGAYYFHFDSKGALFLACLRDRQDRRGDWGEIPLRPELTDLEGAIVALYAMFERVDGEYSLEWPMLQTEFWQTARHEPALAETFHALYQEWVDNLTRFLEHARDRGFVTIDGPLRPIAEVVFAMGQGMDIHRQMYGADGSRYLATLIRALTS